MPRAMHKRAMAALALGVIATLPAAAQDRPLLRPSRDVVVEYRVGGGAPDAARSATVRMYFADRGTKLRIEPADQPDYSIMDRTAGTMIIVMPPQRAYLALPYDRSRVMAFDAGDASFTRLGTAVVAGLPCTVYDETRHGHSGQVCVTADGLLLRARSNDPVQVNGDLEATSVTYAPQPPSLFLPPPGYQQLNH